MKIIKVFKFFLKSFKEFKNEKLQAQKLLGIIHLCKKLSKMFLSSESFGSFNFLIFQNSEDFKAFECLGKLFADFDFLKDLKKNLKHQNFPNQFALLPNFYKFSQIQKHKKIFHENPKLLGLQCSLFGHPNSTIYLFRLCNIMLLSKVNLSESYHAIQTPTKLCFSVPNPPFDIQILILISSSNAIC